MKVQCQDCGRRGQFPGQKCEGCGYAIPKDVIKQTLKSTMLSDSADWSKYTDFKASKILGNFELLEFIGRGGMGVVFRARHTLLEEGDCAIKMIAPELVRDMEAKKRFFNEIMVLRKLSHSGIIRVGDPYLDNGVPYYSMDYVAGKSLRQLLEEKKAAGDHFVPHEAMQIIKEGLEALSFAHTLSKPVVHRDFTPENIMVCGEYPEIRIKVLDFGLVKIITPSKFSSHMRVMGKAYYMAPEQIHKPLEVDARCDLFAAGVVLYEMLTGELPAGIVEPPSQLVGELPAGLDSFVIKALSRSPELRFSSAFEMLDALTDIIAGKGDDSSLHAAYGHWLEKAAAQSGALLELQSENEALLKKLKSKDEELKRIVVLENELKQTKAKLIDFEKESVSPKQGKEWTEPVTGMKFVWVPSGKFMMGSEDGEDHEKPVHEVELDGFWIGKYLVTQAEWEQIMGSNPANFQKGDRYPVEQVSWHDAQTFLSELAAKNDWKHKFALPTEAQWEYAARSGGRNETYAGSESAPKVAWFGEGSNWSTHPVGYKEPNGLGIHDMSGLLWEWCEDGYDSSAYTRHAKKNPVNSGGVGRVMRGGSWLIGASYVRCAYRGYSHPESRLNDIGFRLLKTN